MNGLNTTWASLFTQFQVRADGFDYIAVGNSTNKKDAQTNAAKDFVQYLVRQGLVQQAEVPALEMVTLLFSWNVMEVCLNPLH